MNKLRFSISTKTGLTELVYSPIGWDENILSIERSNEYLGYFNEVISDLRFVKDGAKLLRQLFYSYDPSDIVQLKIEKLNEITLEYYDYYIADIDMMSFEDYDTDVKVLISPQTMNSCIKKNKSVKYTFDIYDSSPVLVYHRKSGQEFWLNKNIVYSVLFGLLDKMTGGKMTSGEFLLSIADGLFTGISITTGYAWRTAPKGGGVDQNVSYTTTFDDVIKSLQTLEQVGVGIETTGKKETFVIKPLSDFFIDTEIIDVGEIDAFKFSVDADKLINSFNVGFEELEDEQCVWECNGNNTYASNYNITANEFSRISVIRGDSVGLDKIKSDNDESYDDYLWFVHIEDNTLTEWAIGKDDANNRAGIIYNGAITPAKLADKQTELISSMMPYDVEAAFTAGSYEQRKNIVTSALPLATDSQDIAATHDDTFYIFTATQDNTVIDTINFKTVNILPVVHNSYARTRIGTTNEGQQVMEDRDFFTGGELIIHPNIILNSGDKLYFYCQIDDSSDAARFVFDTTSYVLDADEWQEEFKNISFSGKNKLFLPYNFTFDAAVDTNFYNEFKTKPYSLIKFRYEDNDYYGFIKKMKVSPSGNCKTEINLLSYTENDLTKLIR